MQPAPANPSLRRNGTYMVFRKLRQDVAGFRNFLATQRPDLMQRDLLAAQMVGRWRNGTPLVRSPDGPVHTDRDAINDFRYEGEDSDGLRCPLGAHIRRLNPRDTAFRDDANRHRLIRRGIPYGTYLPEEAPDDGAERGLLFVAFNARIDLQFEFLQQQWVNRGEFVGQAGNRKDPIIGANAGTVHDQFIVPGSPAPVFNLPRFVSVRGGDYFYAPGIAALKELAREATSGGPSARFPSIPRQPNRGIAKSPTLFDMDRLREIGLGLLRQQCAPTIAIRQVPLIDSQGALPRAQSIAIVAKRRHVARVLSEDLVYQIAPYAQRIWKISGQRMMIGMASNDPERIKRLAILHAAVAKLGTQRVAELVRDLSAQVIDRIRPRGKFDVVQDFGRVIPIGLAAEYFGVSGPNWVSPTAIAAKFGKKDFGEVPRDWLQTLAPVFEADKPLTTVQFWTRFAFLEIFVNIQRAAELTEIAERSTAELLQHIDSVVADAVALAYTNPLWSILIAFFLLHEPVRIRRWTATMIGFLGVLMVVRPAGDIHPAMLAALGSAITASFSMMFIKKLTATESPSKILFYFSVIGSALSLLPAIVFWQTPSAEMAAWMTLMAMCAYVGSLMLARSFALAEITLVAPMDFLRLPIAALVGLTLFNEVPDLWTIAGGLVIAGASAYIARRDAMARKARSPRNPTV